MGKAVENKEVLAGFAALDLEALNYLADRRVVERGLHYFRSFAVEALACNVKGRAIRAKVSGSRARPYSVLLELKRGHVHCRCTCPAWAAQGTCKHGVAALAAVFAVLHGDRGGVRDLPEDYVQELRQGLGLGVGEHPPGSPEAALEVTTFKVIDISAYGGLHFRVVGPMPPAFFESMGGLQPLGLGGLGLEREYFLGDLAHHLKPFLQKAARAGIELRYRSCGGEVALKWSARPCRAIIELNLEGRRVLRQTRFEDEQGARMEVEACIYEAFVLTVDGQVHPLANAEDFVQRLPGGPESIRMDADEFNRSAAAGLGLTGESAGAIRFLREGRPMEPKGPVAAGLGLNCSIHKNAAGEPETLHFTCVARVGSGSVDLVRLQEAALSPLLTVYAGGLLSAKRRVRALLDLVRRFLAESGPEGPPDPARYRSDFPELFSQEYRKSVLEMLTRVRAFLGCGEAGSDSLAVDPETGHFHRYSVDRHQLLMLLCSLSAAETRRGLHELQEGGLTIRRGSSGSEVLRRVLTAGQALGVSVTVDALPVRSVPLSISVDIRASGSDIDWFALHPSIACGERTIRTEEWQQLIRGELLLRGADGSLIMPEPGEGGVAGLKALAQMLRVEPRGGQSGAGHPSVSRLEMLDWIALRRHGVQVALPPVVETLFESLLEFRGIPEFQVPAACQARLRAYQKKGCGWVDFLYRHRFGACLADDMGLGKTVQAIAFITACLERDFEGAGAAAVLIVVPPSLVFNWMDEWQRFAPSVSVVACGQKGEWSAAVESAQVIVTTYDRVRLDIRELEAVHFPVVVFDEAHNLKNLSASRTRAAVRLKRGFTLCLTGTPVENHASEFYSVLSVAVPGLFGSHKEFQDVFRKDPERILGRSRPFVLRRTKTALLRELPRKEEHVLYLEMSPLQKELYTRTVSEVRSEIAEAFADRPEQQAGIVALAAILRLRQVCVSPTLLGKSLPEPAPKFAYLAEKLEELQAEGHAALVFSQFIGGLDGLEAAARGRNLSYLRMDGRLPVARRKDVVDRFQSPDGPPFFFISLKTGGVGLNLTRANYVFHLDPWWNPAVENQATDRAHRIGQKRAVFVERLIMRHSIEARMMELKDRKAELFRQLIELPGAKAARSGLSREDFDYLLEG